MSLYEYKAKVTRVYDGDTITVDIDLGFFVILHKQTIRLFGLDAPEIRGEERENGLVSKRWLRSKIENKDIIIRTVKDAKGKYGRWIGTILLTEDEKQVNINDEMIKAGMAISVEY